MADGIASSGDLELGQQIVAEENERATATSSLTREMHGSRNGELQIGSNSSPLRTGDDPSTADLDEHDLLGYKLKLFFYILEYNFEGAKSIYDKYPEMLRIPLLRMGGDTALHITVSLDRINFVPDRLATWLRYITLSYSFSARTHVGTLSLPMEKKNRIINFVQQLIERMTPEDLQIQNKYGDTALHVAVKNNNNIDCSKLLVERMTIEGRQIPNKDENTALHVAVSKNNIDCSKLLVESMTTKGLQIPNKDGNTALHLAVAAGLQDNFTKLLIECMNPKDLQIQNKYGYTALHVAVSENNIDCLKLLVEHMTTQGLQIRNKDGNTAFCVAATLGHVDCLIIMVQKNNNLPLIPGPDAMFPVHLAAFIGLHKTVQYLACTNNLNGMDPTDIERLFFMTISNNIYDVAADLVDMYPHLATARENNKERLTALHMLARKPLEYDKESNIEALSARDQLTLIKKLWDQVTELGYEDMLGLLNDPWTVLFEAVKSRNILLVIRITSWNPELVKIKDPKSGQNLLHPATLYRSQNILNTLLERGATTRFLVGSVDNNGNNVLHMAAQHQQDEASSSLRPIIQMRRNLNWFKEVEARVPLELRTMKNREGKTPMDVFRANQKKIFKKFKFSAVKIANNGMIVATLIATVAFAAALTGPGDKTSAWFIVFILTNTVAVFTSAASIVSFLSVFTSSRFADNEFINFLSSSLIVGLVLLFISIASMGTAYVAACFLIFAHKSKWVAYVAVLLAPLPILFFPLFHSDLFIDYYNCCRFRRLLHT